jgi:hypothetical protein
VEFSVGRILAPLFILEFFSLQKFIAADEQLGSVVG